jgi:hypothetical protein
MQLTLAISVIKPITEYCIGKKFTVCSKTYKTYTCTVVRMEYIGMLKQVVGYLLQILYYWPEDDPS